jgi:hypothetical protein
MALREFAARWPVKGKVKVKTKKGFDELQGIYEEALIQNRQMALDHAALREEIVVLEEMNATLNPGLGGESHVQAGFDFTEFEFRGICMISGLEGGATKQVPNPVGILTMRRRFVHFLNDKIALGFVLRTEINITFLTTYLAAICGSVRQLMKFASGNINSSHLIFRNSTRQPSEQISPIT